jgi:hypothetical protein
MLLVYMTHQETFGNGRVLNTKDAIRVRKRNAYNKNIPVMVAFSFCAAARGASMPCGCARYTATGFCGLSVSGLTVRGSPGYCKPLIFSLFPFYFFVFGFFGGGKAPQLYFI